MEKVIITINAIIVTFVIGVIFSIFYILMLPICFVLDVIILLVEALNREEYYHNYSGRIYKLFIDEIKHVYQKMIDTHNFE